MLTGYKLKEKTRLFAPKLKALGHPVRLSILHTLSYGELPLHEIVADIDMAQNLTSHHISFLYKTNWVRKRTRGRETYYRLNEKAFLELFRLMDDTPLGKKLRNNEE